jgi:hypothetical protein
MRTLLLALLATALLCACAPFPELDALGPDTGPPPPLLPLEGLINQAQVSAKDPGPALAARASRLKARAAAIKVAPSSP